MDATGAQGDYQVRLDWGVAGLARLASGDVVVVVDVLDAAGDGAARAAVIEAAGTGATVTDATGTDATVTSAPGIGPVVIAAGIVDAAGAAERVLTEQAARGTRTSVTIIAVGEPPPGRERDPDAPLRFAVEDLLGAGAVVDALGAVGIDHTSPEAAAAGEAFRALRGGLHHLVAASVTGRGLGAAGRGGETRAATG